MSTPTPDMKKLIDLGVESKAKPIIEEYKGKIKQLEVREKAVEDREKAFEKKLEEAQTEEERIQAAVEEARSKAEAEIRASEAEIRADEKNKILEAAGMEAKGIVDEANKQAQQILINAEEKQKKLDTAEADAKQITDDALAEADNHLSEAKKKAAQIISEAEEDIKTRRAELETAQKEVQDAREAAVAELKKARQEQNENHTAFVEAFEEYGKNADQKFNEQFAALEKKQEELTLKRISFEESQADIEEDRKYIKALKEKYANCSQAEVDRLNNDISILKGDLKAKNELLEKRTDELIELRKLLGSTDGKSLEDEIVRLTKERDEALNAFADMPSPVRIEQLENAEKELVALKTEMVDLKDQRDKLDRELSLAHFSQKQLDSQTAISQAYEALNAQLQEKLKFISETYKANRESKFAGLLEIDKASVSIDPDRVEAPDDLKQIVSYVRAWGATREENKLYYQEETIMAFIASLAASFDASRLLILQGLSGTGKTSLPRLFAEALGLDCNLVSVQPSWRDNRELLGYDNDFTNRFKETEFTKFVYAASKDQKRITIIILDEMNLARIEYYFADFLSELEMKLEKGKTVWTVPLISNYTEENEEERPDYLLCESGSASLQIGKNVWFVGTANNDDSTSTITDKVYDRAQVLDLDRRADRIIGVNKPEKKWVLSLPKLEALFRKARVTKEYRLSDKDWEKIHMLDSECLQKMDITFGSRISSQLEVFVPVYVACGGTKEKAIDYYLAHKILRKLDEKFDAYIGRRLDELELMIEELYKNTSAFSETMAKIQSLRFKNFGQRDGE